MARSSQKEQTQYNQEPSPTPSPSPQEHQASLVDPVSRVPQPEPYDDIVIGTVEAKPEAQPDPEPVVTFGNDGSITIN